MLDTLRAAVASVIQPGSGRLTHAPADHPPVKGAKVGVLLANLGTPDATDYWSMRRYLNEFLSDRRVIDFPAWKWQPLLQLVILSKRPFTSGANYKLIWDQERNESPLMTITRDQTEAVGAVLKAEYGDQIMVAQCGSSNTIFRTSKTYEYTGGQLVEVTDQDTDVENGRQAFIEQKEEKKK